MIDKRIEVATNSIERNAFIKEVLAKNSSSMHIKFTEDGTPIFNENFGPLPSYFVSQSYFFIIKAMYHSSFTKDKEVILSSLSQASTFSYLTLDTLYNILCGCEAERKSGHYRPYTMSELVPLASMPLIVKDWEKAKILTQELADSLNAKSCIIERGEYKAVETWFIVKLATKVFDIELDKRKPRYPNKEDFKHYQDVLDKWDTEDMLEVDKMSYFLAELHLSIDYEERITDLLVKPYFMQLFPYEILTWLKLREKQGLKNPTEFSHPLMNTPIAKMFLDIKEPLAKPTALPFAKELLEKLQEECPDVEIPEWLDGVEVNAEEKKASDNIIPDDFMS